jgi:2-amino-4-hydroxy-6-hydroxymethyldihydropteridine diphosphokinase
MKHITFLLLGTNQGDRKKNLTFARNAIELSVGPILKASFLYQTAAWGKTDQPDFLNQALEVETLLSPEEVLVEILGIEQTMGRRREEKWGERIMDIDILLYENEIQHSPQLTIPHPELPNRRFALEPLAEIARDIIHPVFHQKIQEMLERCIDPLPVHRLNE